MSEEKPPENATKKSVVSIILDGKEHILPEETVETDLSGYFPFPKDVLPNLGDYSNRGLSKEKPPAIYHDGAGR